MTAGLVRLPGRGSQEGLNDGRQARSGRALRNNLRQAASGRAAGRTGNPGLIGSMSNRD